MTSCRSPAAVLLAAALSACSGGDRVRLDVRTDLPAALRDAVEESFERSHPEVDLRFSLGSVAETLRELEAGEADFDVWWAHRRVCSFGPRRPSSGSPG